MQSSLLRLPLRRLFTSGCVGLGSFHKYGCVGLGSFHKYGSTVGLRSFHKYGSANANVPSDVSSEQAGVDARSVFINNLPYGVTKERVYDKFKQFGDIAADKFGHPNIDLRYRRKFDKPGVAFGFVRYKEVAAANAAIQAKNLQLDGNVVNINKKTSTYHKASFTDQLPVKYEIVLGVSLHDFTEPKVHSMWPCNIVGREIIHLENVTYRLPELQTSIVEFCKKDFTNSSFREKFWRPHDNSDPFIFWVYAVGKHNVHEGKIFINDYFEKATDLASRYIFSIPSLLSDFKKELHRRMTTAELYKGRAFSAETDALDLLVSMAKVRFGRVIRIKVVFDELDGHDHVQFGFLHDHSGVFEDHLKSNPHVENGDIKVVYKYFL